MTTKRLLSFLLTFTYWTVLTGQQLPFVSQYREFHGLLNAASLNSDFLNDNQNISMGWSHRQQWAQLGPISPLTETLRYEQIISASRLLFGGYASYDRVGITTQFSGYVRAAYVVSLGGAYEDLPESGLSFGLNLGTVRSSINPKNVTLSQVDDPDWGDFKASSHLDWGIGAFYYQQIGSRKNRYYYIGLSVPRMNNLGKKGGLYEPYPHFYGLAGVYLPLPLLGDNTFMEVSTWARAVKNVPPQYSVNFRLQPFDNFWFGAGAVFSDSKTKVMLTPELGFSQKLNNCIVKLGVSSQFGGNYGLYFGQTLEVNLAVVLNTEGDD